MDALEVELAGYPYLHAARADLLRRVGRMAEAREAYERAVVLAGNASERRFLQRRLRELDDGRGAPVEDGRAQATRRDSGAAAWRMPGRVER